MNEVARTHDHHDLPLGTIANVFGVTVYDTNETQLQPEPNEFHHEPEEEIGLQSQFTSQRIPPKRRVEVGIIEPASDNGVQPRTSGGRIRPVIHGSASHRSISAQPAKPNQANECEEHDD